MVITQRQVYRQLRMRPQKASNPLHRQNILYRVDNTGKRGFVFGGRKKDNASLRIGSYSLEKVCEFAIVRLKKCDI